MKIDLNIYELRPAKSGKVAKLQSALLAKAKKQPGYRFYSLWDKIWREDVLREAYDRCRRKAGAPGVDGESFARIEQQGVEQWLGNLRARLRSGDYLYETLGLMQLPRTRADQSNAKARKSGMRAGCGKSASPVRRAGAGNGTKEENEAPTLLGESRRQTATPST